MTITARTRFAAVIGAPVEHSLSPALHNAAFAALGLDAVYLAMHVEPAGLADAVAGFRSLGALGASVTVPHKQRVAALCDRVAAPADAIGAVNCLAFERRAGAVTIVGHNTDAGGYIDSLARDAGVDAAGCRAVVLGAGGAARAVVAGLRDAGADTIDVITRTPASATWVTARPWTGECLDAVLPACDLLVDCTSTALTAAGEASLPAPIPIERLPDHAVVSSLIYHRTPALLRAAAERGLRTLDGAGMLVHQGARAFSLWTGRDAPLAAMWTAMRQALLRPPAGAQA